MWGNIKNNFITFIRWIWSAKSLYKKMARWLWYSVILSFVPYLMVILFCLIVGYEINILDTLPDYLLITFAVAANALSIETDNEKEINNGIRGVFKFISRGTLFITAVLYFGLFNEGFTSDSIRALMKANIDNMAILEICVTLVLVFNIFFGILMEISDYFIKRKQNNMEVKKNEISEV